MMEFTEIKAKRLDCENKIKVFFHHPKRRSKNYATQVTIGKNICEKIGLTAGDRVSFSYSNDDPRIWLIRKSLDGDGFKIFSLKNSKRALRISLFLPYPPQEFEKKTHVVRHDFYEGGIRVFSGVDPDQDEEEQKE